MFDNIFSPSPNVWGALVGAMVALPILIHLINMMRHRRVQWAAMDFLLQSYKKQRNWIWLKQLLLLLTRISLLLIALFMLGQVGCNDDRVANFLGSKTTHHYVLLDDSFSMSQQEAGISVFEHACKTVQTIAARAKHEQNQRFTLLRYSKAAQMNNDGKSSSVQQIADVNDVLIDKAFDELLENQRNLFDPAELSMGPLQSLDTIKQLIAERPEEKAQVYLLSDYRKKDWANPAEIESRFVQLESLGAEIQLIDCVKNPKANLAISSLVAVGNVRSAGVPLEVEVAVRNLSETAANKVQVKMDSIFFDPFAEKGAKPTELTPVIDPLATVYFEKIGPGATERQTLSVFFETPGRHVVKATLPEDAVAADNRRWTVIEFKPTTPVLLVTGPNSISASYLSLAMKPGAGKTGIQPETKNRDFLRDATIDQLMKYQSIYLLDVPRLDDRAIKNLEGYVRAGGGLGFFFGENTESGFFNERLYAGGAGLLPLPLEGQFELPELLDSEVPDITPVEHPIFKAFMGVRNSPLNLVRLESFIKPPIEWQADNETETRVAAWVRGKKDLPLVVEKTFGKGRVVAVMTTADPIWHNWNKNPTFIVFMLRLQEFLGRGQSATENHLVGSPLGITLSKERYRSDPVFVGPGQDGESMNIYQPTVQADEAANIELAIGNSTSGQIVESTIKSGIYEAWTLTQEGENDVFRFAMNVDIVESDLDQVEGRALLSDLQRSNPSYLHWDQLPPNPHRDKSSALTKWLFLLLIFILLAEQIMAYSASYHPSPGGARL